MNLRKLLLFTLMFATVVCCQTFAETAQFGYVNVATVVLLHPTMKHFDPMSKLFKLDALKNIDSEERIEENRLKYRVDLNKLEDELKAIESKRIELEEIYLERSENIIASEEQLNSMSNKEKKAYEEKRAKLENDYTKEADELRLKAAYAKQRIEAFRKKEKYTNFATQGETNQLFSLILDDVYEAIKAVTKKKQLSFVFNSSAEITYIESQMTAENRLSEFFDNFKEILDNPDGKVITGAAITSWLEEKNFTFLNCSDPRLFSFVITGGVDLTPEVIDYVYAKHKVGKEQRDFIKEYFEKIVKNQGN